MQVEKYRASTIREAIGRVRKVLGPEAMILSTRKLRGQSRDNGFEIAAVQPGDDISNTNSNPLGEVKAELMSIKEMIYLLNHSGGIIEKLLMNPAILNLYARLIRNGVNDHYARIFLQRAGALKEQPADHVDIIRRKVIKEIIQAIEVEDPFEARLPQPGMSGQARDNNQIIAAFIGTTGVGKTTTIAKLAAQLMFKTRKKVGLISIDNYRIGAMEQLRTYADILGIPCFPAFSRKDLLFAIKRMGGRDVVLIDTAGQSQYDRSRIEELREMITADLGISFHLLLSVATTESEMNRAAINFGPLKCHSYIFTKTDEAEKCGSILNQIMKLRLPISYITTGQNVPEDIEWASKKKIFALLLSKN